jgi:dTDP-glucose 4,6-dehydratase
MPSFSVRQIDLISADGAPRRRHLPPEDMVHVFSHTQGLWEGLRGQGLFITGGTGFVGSWVLESLLWANDELDLRVRVVVLTRDPARYMAHAGHIALHSSVQLVQGDVTDFQYPEGVFPFVIHAATERAALPTENSPLGSFHRDVQGTQRVLEFARTHGTRRFLFTSSGAVYGKQPSDLSLLAEDYSGAPLADDVNSVYGQAKRISEFSCAAYRHCYGIDVVIARLFAFVGPLLPLNANYAIGNFIGDVLGGRQIRISGDGTAYRSYLYAADLAIWLWTILLCGQSGRTYNVGSCDALTIRELATAVGGPFREVAVACETKSDNLSSRYIPATVRAETELALRAWIPLDLAITRTMDWYRRSS